MFLSFRSSFLEFSYMNRVCWIGLSISGYSIKKKEIEEEWNKILFHGEKFFSEKNSNGRKFTKCFDSRFSFRGIEEAMECRHGMNSYHEFRITLYTL